MAGSPENPAYQKEMKIPILETKMMIFRWKSR